MRSLSSCLWAALRAGCASSDYSRRWGAPASYNPGLRWSVQRARQCRDRQELLAVLRRTDRSCRANVSTAGRRRTPFLPLGESVHPTQLNQRLTGPACPRCGGGLDFGESDVHVWSLPPIHRQGSTIELQPFPPVYPALQGAADCLAAAARALSRSLPAHNREPAPCPVAAPAIAGQCHQWSCPPSWRVTCLHGQKVNGSKVARSSPRVCAFEHRRGVQASAPDTAAACSCIRRRPLCMRYAKLLSVCRLVCNADSVQGRCTTWCKRTGSCGASATLLKRHDLR